MAKALAAEYDFPEADAQSAVDRIVAQWREAGLFKKQYDSYLTPLEYGPASGAHHRTYRSGKNSISVACEDRVLFEQLTSVMAPLEQDEGGAGNERLEVIIADGGYGPFLDKQPLWGRCNIDEIRHLIIREVLECLCGRAETGASLHASSVGFGGRAIIFAGESGSGKTTLGLGLVSSGCTYIADDHVMLHRDGRRVFATPLRASAKERSWSLDEVTACLDSDEPYRPRAGVRYAWPGNAAAFGGLHDVVAVVFPKYAADARNEIARLPASESLQRLVDAGARATRSIDSMVPLGSLVSRVPCYELNFDNSGFSVSTCRDLLTSSFP